VVQDNVVLQAIRRDGERWAAEVSFRGKEYVLRFLIDKTGELRRAGSSPFDTTREGHQA
jgi:hypothetical protein